MITHITDKETALTNTLRVTTEALKQVTAERDALAESDKRLRDELGNLQAGFDYYRSQCAHLCKENKVLSDVCDEALLELKARQ